MFSYSAFSKSLSFVCPEPNHLVFEQVNSAKQVEKEVKTLKAKNSDDGVLDKSLEAKLFEHQGRGAPCKLTL